MKVTKVTSQKFVEIVAEKKSCEFVTVFTETPSDLLKTGNPFKGAVKRSHMTANCGFDYSNAVNNQRSREDLESDFKSAPRRWGKRISLKMVENKGNYYLTLTPTKHYDTGYFLNGERLTDEQVAPFKPKAKANKTQGTEKEIIYRDYKIGSIKKINMRGTSYEIV